MTTLETGTLIIFLGAALIIARARQMVLALNAPYMRVPFVIFVAHLVFVTNAVASPIITFDSRQGGGQNIYTTQGVHYDAAEAFWAVSAKALAISLDDGLTFTPLINGTVDLRGHFISSSESGGVVTGHFTTFGSGPSLDLIVADQTGLLLAGTYGARSINGIIGTDSGDSQSTFNVDGGSLASLWPTDSFSGGMVNSLFEITPVFSSDSFTQNFDGHIDGSIFATPEPSSLALLSISALIGIACSRRRRKNEVPNSSKVDSP
jgi:hypothetical protein